MCRVSAINVYKIDLPFTRALACDQRCGLLIAFPNENNILNSDTSHFHLDHQSDCLFSQIRLHLIKYLLPVILFGILGSYLFLHIWKKYIIKNGKISTKIHKIGKIKTIFGLGMTPILGVKNGQIKSLTAIRNKGGHAQWAIKMSRILSHSATALNIFNSYLKRRVSGDTC